MNVQIASFSMRKLVIDMDYVLDMLLKLLAIQSPSGYTDHISRFVAETLNGLQIPFELTRRGAIRANLVGGRHSPDRAVVSHLDTLGAMVKELKPNGRLRIVPIGHWSARFAGGARVTLFTDTGQYRGTILPLKASGHTYGEEIDQQPVDWDHLELRVDAIAQNAEGLSGLGINVGDYIAIDTAPEVTPTGFVNARHLDDKVGVACMLGAAKAVREAELPLPVDCHLLFTISEEVGSGASAALHGDVAEMLAIDNGTVAPGQNTTEFGVTVAMMDSSGPFDFHLTHKLLHLCRDFAIPHAREVFRYYRTDAAAAVEAGNDIRTALVCFGVDASHGYERVHLDSVRAVAELIALYMQSDPTSERDRYILGPLSGFPTP
jgi:peptidase M42 family hydrolase